MCAVCSEQLWEQVRKMFAGYGQANTHQSSAVGDRVLYDRRRGTLEEEGATADGMFNIWWRNTGKNIYNETT